MTAGDDMGPKTEHRPSGGRREDISESWTPALTMAGAAAVAFFVPWATVYLWVTYVVGNVFSCWNGIDSSPWWWIPMYGSWILTGAVGWALATPGDRRLRIGQALIVGEALGFLLFLASFILWAFANSDKWLC